MSKTRRVGRAGLDQRLGAGGGELRFGLAVDDFELEARSPS